MARMLSGKELKLKASELSATIRDGVASCYGVVAFAPGSSFKGLIGTHSCSLEKGGVSLRLGRQRDVRIVVRIILGYRVSAAAVAMTVRQTIEYIVKEKGYALKSLNLYIDGIRLQ